MKGFQHAPGPVFLGLNIKALALRKPQTLFEVPVADFNAPASLPCAEKSGHTGATREGTDEEKHFPDIMNLTPDDEYVKGAV